MKNRVEVKLNPESDIGWANLDDEYFFRDLARTMVSEMPFEELCKLISFNKIDSRATMVGVKDRFELEKIQDLRAEGVVLYSAEVRLP